MSPETPIAAGRDADVFAAGPGLVARRYRDGRPADAEARTIRAVHDLGYPVPRVESCTGPEIVMERVDGPTIGEQLLAEEVALEDGMSVLVELQDRLHALPWPGGASLLHLDFHPLNVIAGPQGPVVIDWSNAEPGPPGLDVAMSALILAGVAVTGEIPEAADLLAAYAGGVTTGYLGHLDRAVEMRLDKPHTTPDEVRLMDDAIGLARSVASR